jgi:AcrR family transcriptional regulator
VDAEGFGEISELAGKSDPSGDVGTGRSRGSTRPAPGGGLSVEGLPAWQLDRRERIVQAALTALQEQEYEQIQIRDVAASAGVALGTLYRYFSSKEHLYAAVLREWAAFGRAASSRTRPASSERVRRRVRKVIRALQREPQFFKAYVLLQTSADPNARQLLTQFAQAAQDSLASEFDMLSADDAQDVSVMLWSIINSMMTTTAYQGGTPRDVHRVVDRFLDLLVPGLDRSGSGPSLFAGRA